MVRRHELLPISCMLMLYVLCRSELDREEKALEEGTGRGLGLRGEWEGDPSWYGGKIRQIASVVETDDGFAIRLRAMMKRKSNRFARFLGSRRMLQVKLPEDKVMRRRPDDVRKFMQNKFVLCGRIFVPFAAKDGKVFLMETNEDYERAGDGPSDRGRISVEDFVRWHNPMELTSKQVGLVLAWLPNEITYRKGIVARYEVGDSLRSRLVRHRPGARLQGARHRHVYYRRRRYAMTLSSSHVYVQSYVYSPSLLPWYESAHREDPHRRLWFHELGRTGRHRPRVPIYAFPHCCARPYCRLERPLGPPSRRSLAGRDTEDLDPALTDKNQARATSACAPRLRAGRSPTRLGALATVAAYADGAIAQRRPRQGDQRSDGRGH